MKPKIVPLISTIFSANSAIYTSKHSKCKLPNAHKWSWEPRVCPNQALIWDTSWNAKSNQPRLALAWRRGKKKYISAKLDINETNAYSVSSQEALDIPRYILKKSKIKSVRIQRGLGDNKATIIPVIGETSLDLRHAKGRTCRQKSKIEDEDLKNLKITTLVIAKFPNTFGYDVIAGGDFLELNELYADARHGQLLDKQSRSFIQFAHPTQESYQSLHSQYWKKHSYVPKQKIAKPKMPKSCDQCHVKIETNVAMPKFIKDEYVDFNFELRDIKHKMSGIVTTYSNSHYVNIKVPNKKLQITVPECTISKRGDSEAPLKHKKYLPPFRNCQCLQQGFQNHSFFCNKLWEQPSVFRTTAKPPPKLSISPVMSISIAAITAPAYSEIYSEFDVPSEDGHCDRIEDWVDTTLKEEAEKVHMEEPKIDNPRLPSQIKVVEVSSGVLMVQEQYSDGEIRRHSPVNLDVSLKLKTKSKLKSKKITPMNNCTPIKCYCQTHQGLCKAREPDICTPSVCYCRTPQGRKICMISFPSSEPVYCNVEACFCGPGWKQLCRTRF